MGDRVMRRHNLFSALSRFGELIRRDGLISILTMSTAVAYDRFVNPFDRRFGTDTDGFVPADEVRSIAVGDNPDSSSSYTATNTISFKRFLEKAIPQPAGRFVDYGCGKARVVLLAVEHGFPSASGIEHAPPLAEIASDNVEIYRRASGTNADIEIHQGDAAIWPVPDDLQVAFFYNPFPMPIIEQVLKAIDASVAESMRPVLVVFQTLPTDWQDTAPTRLGFEQIDTVSAWGKDYHVFEPRRCQNLGSEPEPAIAVVG